MNLKILGFALSLLLALAVIIGIKIKDEKTFIYPESWNELRGMSKITKIDFKKGNDKNNNNWEYRASKDLDNIQVKDGSHKHCELMVINSGDNVSVIYLYKMNDRFGYFSDFLVLYEDKLTSSTFIK